MSDGKACEGGGVGNLRWDEAMLPAMRSWFILNPKDVARSDAYWGNLVWHGDRWMYRRYRYPLWWRMWVRIHAALDRFGEWLQCLDLRQPHGKEYWEPANLSPEVEEYIAGLKDVGKKAWRIKPLFNSLEDNGHA